MAAHTVRSFNERRGCNKGAFTKEGRSVRCKTDKESYGSQKRAKQGNDISGDSHPAFNTFTDMICILDRNSRITHVNPTFSQHLKLPYQKIIVAKCFEILHGTRNLAVLTRDLLEFARPRIDAPVPVDVHGNPDASIELAA